MDKNKIGVVIGRFQVHELHDGHKFLINYVMGLHERVILFLGVSSVKMSVINPLDFETRKLMLEEIFGKQRLTILPLHDVPRRDDLWSFKIDRMIEAHSGGKEAILYGSRGSFIPHYQGKFQTQEIPAMDAGISGTETRKQIAKVPLASKDFRAGVIYACFSKYPIVYSTIDVAIMDSNRTKVILGRKPNDPIGKYRFIGGFVDKEDLSEKVTIRRESYEETKSEVEPGEFIGSIAVREDPRYKNEPDQSIMTHFYLGTYVYGRIEGADDIEEVKWFDIKEVNSDIFVPEHRVLYCMLNDHLAKGTLKTQNEEINTAA